MDVTGKWKRNDTNYKVMNDPIHGHIEIHPLCMKIIDTPEFQRLRYLKQLGAGYYVYPGASHNRFEHSIGVCHLAGEMVSRLKKQQPELDITEDDVLCVKIAGLCHDLGHGPFSHVFDGKFIPLVVPGSGWKHEEASIQMFEHLIEKNNIDLKGLDIDFIKKLITGLSDKDEDKDDKDKDKKKYLYEIVANKRNSVDVDKFDYFARDSYMLGIKNNFDHHRFMRFCRVIEDENDDLRICIRDKEAENLYEMFHTRKTLHSRAYQHAVTQAVESMIVDALVIADQCESFTIMGTNDKPLRLSECINDMVAYTKLDDTIFQRIMCSTEPDLQDARVLIDRIQKRQLYKCLGLIRRPHEEKKLKDHKKGEKEMLEEIAGDRLNSKFLRLSRVRYDYGMKQEDPVSHTRFYSKDEPNECLELCPEQGPQMLPRHFQLDMIRIFCTERDEETMQAAKSAFKEWCSDKQLKPENIRGGFRFQKVTKKEPKTQ
ncbi:hypothetical protein SNE40_008496 [Patella caerulea]|uniref:HD domain-containing protein n=1 Tax=Patella caerulea TaxID=87958 RepID=A0AAN8Q3R5_PATCE